MSTSDIALHVRHFPRRSIFGQFLLKRGGGLGKPAGFIDREKAQVVDDNNTAARGHDGQHWNFHAAAAASGSGSPPCDFGVTRCS